MKHCPVCGIQFTKRHQVKFCSNQCQRNFAYSAYVRSWKNGGADGNRGINTRNISGYLKRYLLEKFDNKCSECGWHKKHPVTGVVPLEVEHVDGNAENNTEKNLKLLCPNCHALTPFYKNLNKGNGRKWRMKKYIKNV